MELDFPSRLMFGVSVAGYGANLSAGVTLYSAAATSAIDHLGSNGWGSVDSRQQTHRTANE